MSLSVYKQKRNFSETPEPAGKEQSSKKGLRFVVQKHNASHLHYDFRLELDGVLKSWAVPKGPSLNPADKRLAMQVEDHPYDYRRFEGTIPAGNYGAGTVIVWDEGFYELDNADGRSKAQQEKSLLHDWEAGKLELVLHGQKLRGRYTLLRVKRDEEGRSWLLIKKKDEYASSEDVTEQNQSVLSGKTIAQLEGKADDAPAKTTKGKTKLSAPATKKAVATPTQRKMAAGWLEGLSEENKKKIKKAKMPWLIKPMLATLVDAPFDSSDWLFEIKWDGYRSVAYMNNGAVDIISRNNKPFTQKYAPVTNALQALGLNAVLDGEIVAVNEKGLANFQMLQNWQNMPVKLQYFVFDIIWLDGYDLTGLPLIERKSILKKVLPADDELIQYSDHVVGKGKQFFDAALKQGLEGVMAKKADSPYETGSRTENWLKVKVNKRQEVIITGFTEPRNTRKFFGALLLGVYQDNELIYVGHTGSGFNRKSLEEIYHKLQPLVTDQCPFAECPRGNMPVTWVKPKLVCEIKFTEWTKELMARHPIFMGLRSDKKAKDVTIENAQTRTSVMSKLTSKTARATAPKKTAAKKAAPKKAAAKKSAVKKAATKRAQKKSPLSTKTSGLQLDLSEGNDQAITLDGHELKLTHLDKWYWQKEQCSKGEVINHYLRMAPYILPYMLQRPQSLHRYPNGVGAPSFYQKDVRGKVPEWMQTHEDFSESTGEHVQYLVCSNEATLVYMANLGCIEMHPWHSRVGAPLQPDWCLIDLDPDTKNSFDQVIEVAQVTRQIIESIGATCYAKTSGSTGIHIYLPLGAQYDYDQSKQLAELIVTLVHGELPGLTSVERNPAKRKGKIYLDFLQNRETQTAAAPYSLRPKPGVPVSTPLHWDEVKPGLTPTTYHIRNIYERVQSEGDLFVPVLGKGIDLEKVLKKMQSLLP